MRDIYICDFDHTIFDSCGEAARHFGVSIDKVKNPRMEIDGISHEEILNYWIDPNGLYRNGEFNWGVVDFLNGKNVVMVSLSKTKNGIKMKSDLIAEFFEKHHKNESSESFLPKNLIPFLNEEYEEVSYFNIVEIFRSLGFNPIAVDDSPRRIEFAKKLKMEYILVEQNWNKDYATGAKLILKPNKHNRY